HLRRRASSRRGPLPRPAGGAVRRGGSELPARPLRHADRRRLSPVERPARRQIRRSQGKGLPLASYVSSRAFVGDWLEMGENCIILDNVGIEPGARLGDNVALWSNVTIGHHAVIGDHCWLAAHGIVGGNASLGPRCFLGLNVTIGHQTTIGTDSFLGAGAVVTKSAADNSVFVGRDTELFRLDSKRFLHISKML